MAQKVEKEGVGEGEEADTVRYSAAESASAAAVSTSSSQEQRGGESERLADCIEAAPVGMGEMD